MGTRKPGFRDDRNMSSLAGLEAINLFYPTINRWAICNRPCRDYLFNKMPQTPENLEETQKIIGEVITHLMEGVLNNALYKKPLFLINGKPKNRFMPRWFRKKYSKVLTLKENLLRLSVTFGKS